MTSWPWKTKVNPYANAVRQRCAEWCSSFPMMAKAYKKLDPNQLLVVSLFSLVIVLVDDSTDVEDAAAAQQTATLVRDALQHPHQARPFGEAPIGEIVRRFWQLAIQTTHVDVQSAFLTHFDAFLESVVAQAGFRDHDSQLSIDAYLTIRRDTVGVMPFFPFLRPSADDRATENVWNSPIIAELTGYIVDMYIYDNDTISYAREHALGDIGHNIITLLMRDLNIDLGSAVSWAVMQHAVAQRAFIEGIARLPSWDADVDRQVRDYLDGLGHWAKAYHTWAFEVERYFGDRGKEVKATGLVRLRRS
ncbi:terpenoid synthase [Coniophora puteana RWD-64-598 SS2]|uniref:Terpene synthase n=1 Tax=Coniophora puteana (strain RWD-64-598) TaxID=741705 RepID=A0A5M3MW72_CONPW|nr:terpenoid synthase [Coniophora puteana RWD-64-598 SS2]EIW83393.1 terpenoid synthase [Coniophora puteana RWD-64-598 SS2]